MLIFLKWPFPRLKENSKKTRATIGRRFFSFLKNSEDPFTVEPLEIPKKEYNSTKRELLEDQIRRFGYYEYRSNSDQISFEKFFQEEPTTENAKYFMPKYTLNGDRSKKFHKRTNTFKYDNNELLSDHRFDELGTLPLQKLKKMSFDQKKIQTIVNPTLEPKIQPNPNSNQQPLKNLNSNSSRNGNKIKNKKFRFGMIIDPQEEPNFFQNIKKKKRKRTRQFKRNTNENQKRMRKKTKGFYVSFQNDYRKKKNKTPKRRNSIQSQKKFNKVSRYHLRKPNNLQNKTKKENNNFKNDQKQKLNPKELGKYCCRKTKTHNGAEFQKETNPELNFDSKNQKTSQLKNEHTMPNRNRRIQPTINFQKKKSYTLLKTTPYLVTSKNFQKMCGISPKIASTQTNHHSNSSLQKSVLKMGNNTNLNKLSLHNTQRVKVKKKVTFGFVINLSTGEKTKIIPNSPSKKLVKSSGNTKFHNTFQKSVITNFTFPIKKKLYTK
ncbi:hypothetical protein M0813_01866 [Anaeramoeba flamelloides]|uniref:Uncharacterized protein n=1 Tax=Anaeramoeba flamelloides TaxID=1746091 RepID=A0ABQ8YXP5_9EUKA|nr:hypothetical protein M0813_01866 [Anaeramoeba flamelloides]